jgi:Mn-dependent DtxR family transcriptional regulator
MHHVSRQTRWVETFLAAGVPQIQARQMARSLERRLTVVDPERVLELTKGHQRRPLSAEDAGNSLLRAIAPVKIRRKQ